MNQEINSEGSGLVVGHDQYHPQYHMATELFTYQLDKDSEDPGVMVLNTFPYQLTGASWRHININMPFEIASTLYGRK